MNFTELIYKMFEFFFNNTWHMLQFIIIILILRKDVEKGIKKVKSFFHDVRIRYRKTAGIKTDFSEVIQQHKPSILKSEVKK